MKHRITINVTDPNGRRANVLRGADMTLPARLVRFLFGDFQQIYLLSPGQTVESVNISEVKEGEKVDIFVIENDNSGSYTVVGYREDGKAVFAVKAGV